VNDLGHGVGSGPFSSGSDSACVIFLPSSCNIGSQWVVWVRGTEECLDRKENGSDLEGWRPVAFKNVQTDAPKLVNIWVVNLGEKSNLWWGHRIVIGKEELKFEDSAFVW